MLLRSQCEKIPYTVTIIFSWANSYCLIWLYKDNHSTNCTSFMSCLLVFLIIPWVCNCLFAQLYTEWVKRQPAIGGEITHVHVFRIWACICQGCLTHDLTEMASFCASFWTTLNGIQPCIWSTVFCLLHLLFNKTKTVVELITSSVPIIIKFNLYLLVKVTRTSRIFILDFSEENPQKQCE